MDNNNSYPSSPFPYNPGYGYTHGPAPSKSIPTTFSSSFGFGFICLSTAFSSWSPHIPFTYRATGLSISRSCHWHPPSPNLHAARTSENTYNSDPYQLGVYPAAPPPQPGLQQFNSFQYGSYHHLQRLESGRLQPPDVQSGIPSRLSCDYPGHHRHQGWETSPPVKAERPSPTASSIARRPKFPYGGMGMQLVEVSSSKTSLRGFCSLHGDLDIWVYEAKNLSKHGVPFQVGDRDSNRLPVPVAHYAAELNFVVKDNDIVGGKPCKVGAVLSLSIQYNPIEQLSIYHHGIGAGPHYPGVPGTYFPLRRGGTVTLYQDAHVPDGCLPNLRLDNGTQYMHGKCWRDIFDAIRRARRLIYITGWSVWHKVRLVRDDNSVSEYTLGEVLKSKSQEGVRVLLLIWDDPTSRSILGYKTHDTTGQLAIHLYLAQ
ncbi:UNVERIFIED_CONTAM: Phospholipase D beta 1 [Sesamum latifolium]|uniref:Phospholipase D beta 1 n=1 Tax=Sesamum latifolium TaxID=2727402 RepID=A0AAW2YFY5_9LAMI